MTPSKRHQLPDGWCYEILPLAFGRGRIVATDGTFINDFW